MKIHANKYIWYEETNALVIELSKATNFDVVSKMLPNSESRNLRKLCYQTRCLYVKRNLVHYTHDQTRSTN